LAHVYSPHWGTPHTCPKWGARVPSRVRKRMHMTAWEPIENIQTIILVGFPRVTPCHSIRAGRIPHTIIKIMQYGGREWLKKAVHGRRMRTKKNACQNQETKVETGKLEQPYFVLPYFV